MFCKGRAQAADDCDALALLVEDREGDLQVLGHTVEAVEMLSRAYSDAPAMVDDDLAATPFLIGEDGLRMLTGRVVELSNRSKSVPSNIAAAALLTALVARRTARWGLARLR